MIARLIHNLSEPLRRLREINHQVSEFRSYLLETRQAVEIIASNPKTPEEPTYVYFLPPNGGAMFAMRAEHGQQELRFVTQTRVPKGTWVVAIGSARVTDVLVGNCIQNLAAGFHGQVCLLADEPALGVYITVRLKGSR